jgi:glutamyl-tRNA reductase
MTTNTADRLLMVGLSHRHASLDLLERTFVHRDEVPQVLRELRTAGYDEAVVLSTCSRTEIYVAAGDRGPGDLVTRLQQRAGRSVLEVRQAAHVRVGPPVVAHLFRVVAGFESRVVGEVDVHAHVRAAFRLAQGAGMTGTHLGRLFPAALHCSTQVRARTGLDTHARSLARKAVEVGLREVAVPPGASPRILVVGSGQMAATAVEHLAGLGLSCSVAAHDEAYAARLVGPRRVRPLCDLAAELASCDLLICATSATQPVITDSQVRRAMAGRGRRLTIVDLAVPRNVNASVATIDGVQLIDLTGLNDEAAGDPVLQAAIETGSSIITAAARAHLDEITARDAGPVIAAMRRRVEDTCLTELSGLAEPGASPDELVRAAHVVAGRLLHLPTLAARRAAAVGDTHTLLLLCEMYGVSPAEVGLGPRHGAPLSVVRLPDTAADAHTDTALSAAPAVDHAR